MKKEYVRRRSTSTMSEVYFLKQIENLKKGKTNEKIEKQFKKLLKKTKLMKKRKKKEGIIYFIVMLLTTFLLVKDN